MKRISHIIIAVVFLFSGSCKKEKSCPAFNENDLQYIAYAEFDTLTFTNNQNDTFQIYIEEFHFSESYKEKYETVFNVKKIACLNYVDLFASDSRNTSSYVFLKMEQSDVSEMRYFKYNLLDFYFEIDFENEVPYIDDFDYMELVPNLSINDTIYNNVVRYRDIQHSSEVIQSVYLNKKDGILKFVENVSGVEWIKTKKPSS